LDSADIKRLVGTNLLAARGQLDLEYELQVSIGQAPFYINGPRRVAVRVHGRDSAGNPIEATAQN